MRNIYRFLLWLLASAATAQSPNDGLMMPQGQLCILGQYTNSAWQDYWQGETKRDNQNLGTVSTQSALLMVYGCIHYRFDSENGLVHGKKVGEFAVMRGRNDGSE